MGFLLRVHKAKIKLGWVRVGGSREDSTSKLIQLVGIFRFLVVVKGLMSCFLAGGSRYTQK